MKTVALVKTTTAAMALIKKTTKAVVIVDVFNIRNFKYNGFFIRMEPGYAEYTARFLSWTGDPGITVCQCSDGEKRLIPSCVMEQDGKSLSNKLPEQGITDMVNKLGTPSRS